MADEPVSSDPRTPQCPFCLAAIAPSEATESCPACRTVYHADCWAENGGCAVYGCAKAPAIEPRRAIEVPLSYWGQENKPCPACGQEILAAAVRCRHCGATFNSARPQNSADFQAQSALEGRLPKAKTQVIVIFSLSAIPFLSPIGALWGGLWKRSHRAELEALPPIFSALHRIGMITAIVLTSLVAVMTALYIAVRGH